MQAVVTAEQMRSIDKAAIDGDIETGYEFMQKAGKALEETVYEMLPKPGTIWVLCGGGNNGGDGFVVSRLLKENGYPVWCFCMVNPQSLKNEAQRAYMDYLSKGVDPVMLRDVEQLEGKTPPALVIDAIFGTGLDRAPEEHYAAVIRHINKLEVQVLSVDTPSGCNHRTGKLEDPTIRASLTLEMGYPKLSTFFFPGNDACGKRRTADLGYNPALMIQAGVNIWQPEKKFLSSLLPRRKSWGNKRDHGVAAILAASPGMTGAATLASEGALRSGCGMSFLAHPAGLQSVLASRLTEIVLRALPEDRQGMLCPESKDGFSKLLLQANAALIGPGIGVSENSTALLQDLVREVEIPLVLDADALNTFVDHPEILAEHKGPLVLTPHRREWARIFGELPEEFDKLVTEVRNTAAKYRSVLVLKGSPTIVAVPRGFVFLMPFGNSGLATAGSGDVLAGIITSMLAQGCSLEDAALLGVWLHGRAGELASEELTEYCMVARDILTWLPAAFKELLQ